MPETLVTNANVLVCVAGDRVNLSLIVSECDTMRASVGHSFIGRRDRLTL